MSEESLADWLRRLEQLHPSEIDLGLDRIKVVAERLNLLDPLAKTVIVAGTNGKGTVVALLQAVLSANGVSHGAYMSPHLERYNERIRINGEPVSDYDIVSAFEAIDRARGDVSLTYFEFGTLAALWIFRGRAVHWQVLEVGLGGRLDAANMIDAEVAAVTSIGLDHQEWLGPDREHIAIEKAHVARAGRPCVVLERSLPSSLLPALDDLGAQVTLLGRDFDVQDGALHTAGGAVLDLPRPAGLLPDNVAGALQLAELMGLQLDTASVRDAVNTVVLPGRRQVMMAGGVQWIFDVAHNREAVAALIEFIDTHETSGRTHAIYASLSDKPFHDILAAVGTRVHQWYFPAFTDLPRAVDPSEYHAQDSGGGAGEYASFEAAWQAVNDSAEVGDRVLVFGSFITVGAALAKFREDKVSHEH